MLTLESTATKLIPGHGPNHQPILSILCKRTYSIAHKQIARHEDSVPTHFHQVDQYYDQNDPTINATKHETDLVAFKPLTDIILHACARPAKGKQAHFLDVGIVIRKIAKRVRVFGNRKIKVTALGFEFTEPEPFDCIRLDYANAYGGVDRRSKPGYTYPYPRNPVGKGFILGHAPAALQDLNLPNLEDPEALLTPSNLVVGKYENWEQAPEPVAFGYVSRNSHPRYLMAGLSKSDYLQSEIDRQVALDEWDHVGVTGHAVPPTSSSMGNSEYHNGASPGLRLPYLRGDESIVLKNMDPLFPDFEFSLNPEKPRPWIQYGKGKVYLDPVIQTVEIFKESNLCSVLWRASANYSGLEWFRQHPEFTYGADD